MADDQIDTPAFATELLRLVDDAEARAELRRHAQGLAQDKAAVVLADNVEEAVR